MNWRPFDIIGFLNASKSWKVKREILEQQLEDISYLPSSNNETGIRGSNISEPPYSITLERQKIQAKIDEIKANEAMLDYGMKRLAKDEIELINGFFFPKKRIGVFVQEYGRKYGIRERGVYDKRKYVLEKLRMEIESKYYK